MSLLTWGFVCAGLAAVAFAILWGFAWWVEVQTSACDDDD